MAKSRACFGLTTATGKPVACNAQARAASAAAGGLHHHQRHAQGLQSRRQRRVAFYLIVDPLGRELAAQHRDIDVRFGHVDAHYH